MWEGTNKNALHESSISLKWGKLFPSWKKMWANLMTSTHSYLRGSWWHIITNTASIQELGNLVHNQHSTITKSTTCLSPWLAGLLRHNFTMVQKLLSPVRCSFGTRNPPLPKADTSTVNVLCSSAFWCQGLCLITARNICTWEPHGSTTHQAWVKSTHSP